MVKDGFLSQLLRLTDWIKAEHIAPHKVFRHISRDIMTFSLELMQRKT
jgi:hypothetical protein